jgi:hypothetical protein
MKKSKNKLYSIIFLTTLLFPMLAVTAGAQVSDVTSKEKAPSFLSDVVGIDLSKYSITDSGYRAYYTGYGNTIYQENYGFTLNSTDSIVTVGTEFKNGCITWFHVWPMKGSIIYRIQPSSSAVTESRNILQRYQVFAEKYGITSGHVSQALSLLNKVSDAKSPASTSQTLNNIGKFDIMKATSGDMTVSTKPEGLLFYYSFDGIDVRNRDIILTFESNEFNFRDTWDLYSVGSINLLSSEQTTNLALTAAKNYKITLMDKNDQPFTVTPDFTNATFDVGMNMVPGELVTLGAESSLNFTQSSTARNALSLYPLWQSIVYFTEPIGNIAGIQVGIWGDTKEIAYIGTYGHLGGATVEPSPSVSEASPSPSPQPTLLASASIIPSATDPNLDPSNTNNLVLALAIIAALAAFVTVVVVRKKRK